MKKLLITGFEAFGGETINPSWNVVESLPCEIGEFTLNKQCLPVVFSEASSLVIKYAEQIRPNVIICVGQAGGRKSITPEFVAINLRHASIPDNCGNMPQDLPIIENSDAAHFTTLKIREICQAMRSIGIPAEVSYSAGTYVCNDVMYTLLDHFKNSDVKVGFIHIPYCEEQNKEPSLKLCDVSKALCAAIKVL